MLPIVLQVKYVTAHETGHMIGMADYPYQGPPGRLSVMVEGDYFAVWDPEWANIPATYDSADNDQLQVR